MPIALPHQATLRYRANVAGDGRHDNRWKGGTLDRAVLWRCHLEGLGSMGM